MVTYSVNYSLVLFKESVQTNKIVINRIPDIFFAFFFNSITINDHHRLNETTHMQYFNYNISIDYNLNILASSLVLFTFSHINLLFLPFPLYYQPTISGKERRKTCKICNKNDDDAEKSFVVMIITFTIDFGFWPNTEIASQLQITKSAVF